MGVTGDKLEVVYSQEKPAPKCTMPLAVPMTSTFGLMFPLTKDSFFTGYQVIRSKLVESVCLEPESSRPTLCPWSKYSALEAIAAERKLQLVQQQQILAKAKAYRAAHPVTPPAPAVSSSAPAPAPAPNPTPSRLPSTDEDEDNSE